MDHLAIPVTDQDRSRRFYETYFGFGARPPRRYDDGVLMLYDAKAFALALGPSAEPLARPAWMHFGIALPDRDAVLALGGWKAQSVDELYGSGLRPSTLARELEMMGREKNLEVGNRLKVLKDAFEAVAKELEGRRI